MLLCYFISQEFSVSSRRVCVCIRKKLAFDVLQSDYEIVDALLSVSKMKNSQVPTYSAQFTSLHIIVEVLANLLEAKTHLPNVRASFFPLPFIVQSSLGEILKNRR